MNITSRFIVNKPLSEVSTFGIGGPAKYYLEAQSVEDVKEALLFCKQEKLSWFVLGKGSNSLFDDRGFNGLIIANRISFCTYEGNKVRAGAGYSFSLLGVQTARKGFAGLEFASGIPATVGGAVFMNAGANGGETFDCLHSVEFLSEEGQIINFTKDQLKFGYRTSSFQTMPGVILSATFDLTPSTVARQKQLDIVDYRTKTQPYSDKSAGCMFRNPTSKAAGALIQQCGLKGFQVGGAEVSTLHGNFIVNKGGATAADVIKLARHVQQIVKDGTGEILEMEVRVVPYEMQEANHVSR